MKIYSFFSGDTVFITKSKSLIKARKIGKENEQTYIENCKYLEEEPEELRGYFVPEELEEISTSEARRLVKTDKDVFVLEDDLEAILTAERRKETKMKQIFETEVIERMSDSIAHRAARIALERYLPFDMDWDDVTIYRVFPRDNDIAYEYLSAQVGDMWGTDDSGNIYILQF